MARIKMVTRTIEATKAEVKVVDNVTDEITTIDCKVSGIFKETTDPTLIKAVKKQVETPNLMVLKIVEVTDASELYGMTEADFMKLAKVLDKDTRKVIETEDNETEAESELNPIADEPKTQTKKKGAEA